MPEPVSTLRWIRPPQQTRSQETLVRILDAAEALITEKGFEDTAVAEVARRAGSSVGAFYSRFRDKTGLLYGLYDRYEEQAFATADDALDPKRWKGARVEQFLPAVMRFLVEVYRERSGLLRAFVLRSHADDEFRARQERLYTYVSEKLAALLLARREQIAKPHPERAAAFALTMAFATIENALLFGELRSAGLRFSDEELAREITAAYLAYLGVAAADDTDQPD